MEEKEELLSREGIKYIIARVLDNAKDAMKEREQQPDSAFLRGKLLAYYEVLDTIQNELYIHEQDAREFGLDIDIDKIF